MATSTPSLHPAAPPPLPSLVFDYGETATLYGVSDGVHRPCEAEELRNKRCWATSHGWVLCCDPATLATFLWNPQATGDDGGGGKIALPPFAQPPPSANSECALSREPNDAGGHFTVVIVEPPDSNVLWYCHVVSGGGGGRSPAGWAKHEYDLGGTNVRVIGGYHYARRYISGLTACRGRFYYFHTATEYGVVDFSPAPVFSTVPMKAVSLEDKVPAGETMARTSCYTLEIDGELYIAYVFFHGADTNTVVDVGVYRMDFRKRKPVRVRSISDRAIVAGSSCFCFAGWCPAAASGLRPNSIYWMSPFDKCLHVFDIGAKTKKLREPYKGVEKPLRKPFWMIPAHR